MEAHNPERSYGVRFRQAPLKWLAQQVGGMAALMAWALLITGTTLAMFDKLGGNWIALAGIIQALVTFRAVAEDKFVVGERIKNGPKNPAR